MAIFIQHGRVTRGVTGKRYITNVHLVQRFENDHLFGFDIRKPSNWRKFLRKYRTENGKLLPRYTKEGDPVAYYVFIVGVPIWMREYLRGSDAEHFSYFCLYPGEKLRNDKRHKGFLVAKYGTII